MMMTEEQRDYLNWLRSTGVTNMYGAAPYLQKRFPELNRHSARDVLVEWINTYDPEKDDYR